MTNRRDFLRWLATGAGVASASGWMETLAADTATNPARKRACILLWMNGGPSQMDTFDLKPGHANGGPFKGIDTPTPGMRISEHLPQLAKWSKRLAIVRSMNSREGDHGRATYLLRTGNLPMGGLAYPTLGSLLSKENGDPQAELPNFVSISPFRVFNPAAFQSGFLGPQYAPLVVAETLNFGAPQANGMSIDAQLQVRDLVRPDEVNATQATNRIDLLRDLEKGFARERDNIVTQSHALAYQRAAQLMQSSGSKAFDLTLESDRTRERYGNTLFGQGCLLARRLVERSVPFVEVSLSGVAGAPVGWDTHATNFDQVKALSGVLDAGWASLMHDLHERGMLDSTLIVWMGEFGRTPKINAQQGRDHWPNTFSAVLAGGGIRGGQVIGKTSADGTTIAERPVSVPDLLATICGAMGIDPSKTNASNIGRPIRIVDKGAKPITEVIA